jgi:hypothetical protein
MLRIEQALHRVPRTYRPLVAYAMNAPLERDALQQRVGWFHEIGYGGLMLVPWPGLPNGFMDDAWLESVGHVMDRAAELGLEVWIWDEWTFPSGFGGGLVTEDPRFRARRLHISHDLILEPSEEISLTVPERVVSGGWAPVNKYVYYAPAGAWQPLTLQPGSQLTHRAGAQRERLVIVSWEYLSFQEISVTGNDPEDPTVCTVDMLNPDATRRFTQVVHECYAEAVGEHMGRTLKGFFYDEPELPYVFPWTERLAEAFQQRKGYDLRERLPMMMTYLPVAYMGMGGYPGVADDVYALANDYLDVWTDLVADGFYGVLETWCHEHGVLSIGHQDLDHKMNTLATVSGHFFKNSARNDHPGVDIIWQHVEPGRWIDFTRYAGSAARVLGKERGMSETLAEMGRGMHADAQRYVMEQQIVRNVTQFFLMASAYDGEAPGYEEDPDLLPGNPLLDAFGKDLHERIGRVSALMNVGQTGCEVGLYLPMYDISQEQHRLSHPHARNNYPSPWETVAEIAEHLTYLPCEFDYLWDDALRQMEPGDGGLVAPGGHTYRVIAVPPRSTLRPDIVARLEAFVSAGGVLLMYEEPLPTVEAFAHLCVAPDDLDPYLPRPVRLSPAGGHISTARRLDQGRSVYLLLNEDVSPHAASVAFSGHGRLFEIDPNTGHLTLVGVGDNPVLSVEWDATALRIFVLDEGESLSATRIALAQTGEPRELRAWRVTLPDGTERALDGSWPSWGDLGLPTYSGWMRYRASFVWDSSSTTASLNLGDVCYAAEVWLDGAQVATMPFRPYRAIIGGLTRADHTLEVRVLNTPANEVCGTRERDIELHGREPSHKVLPDRTKLRSGLFGPVRLIPMG